jgi:hypothetical protein
MRPRAVRFLALLCFCVAALIAIAAVPGAARGSICELLKSFILWVFICTYFYFFICYWLLYYDK